MNSSDSFSGQDEIVQQAGAWFAKRDRGLTAAEQDLFHEWLAADPRHSSAMALFDKAWTSLDSLAAWQPADGVHPNPDLLAPTPSGTWTNAWKRWGIPALAVASLVVATTVLVSRWSAPLASPARSAMRVIPAPERQALPDGSVAEVNHGGRVEVEFAPAERRVRLQEGEVHVSVAKDTSRPFIVDAGAVKVRAVGTAFSVRLESDGVNVLVTEGTVQIESPGAAPVAVTHGELARVEPRRSPQISSVTPDVVARDLAWRTERLEFDALPLRAVVAEFNQRNTRQLIIGDEAAGRVKVAGTFQANAPEAFARLLEAGFGIAVNRREVGGWVLTTAPAKK